jgi:hypothetical protein
MEYIKMTQVELIVAFAEAVGIDIHDLRADINAAIAKTGDLTTLTTTAKNSIVAALNELKTGLTAVSSSAVDSAYVDQKVAEAITGLEDNAPEVLNTIGEISTALKNDPEIVNTILAALAKRVRVDAVQSFTVAEMDQGCKNLGIGEISTFDPKGAYEAKRDAA